MRFTRLICQFVLLITPTLQAQTKIPTEWIDPDTGHRVIRLSREDGSQSAYFHQHEFTPDGKKLIFTAPSGLYTVDLSLQATRYPSGHRRCQ